MEIVKKSHITLYILKMNPITHINTRQRHCWDVNETVFCELFCMRRVWTKSNLLLIINGVAVSARLPDLWRQTSVLFRTIRIAESKGHTDNYKPIVEIWGFRRGEICQIATVRNLIYGSAALSPSRHLSIQRKSSQQLSFLALKPFFPFKNTHKNISIQ